MKTLLVVLLAACVMGCGTIGTYAGMDIGLGYGHNFGNDGGFSGRVGDARANIGANRFYSGSSYFYGSDLYPDDTLNISATILLRPEKE